MRTLSSAIFTLFLLLPGIGYSQAVISLHSFTTTELREMILRAHSKDSPQGKFLRANPKFLEFLIEISRDDRVLQGLVKISSEKKKLKTFGFSVICTFMIFFFWGLRKKDHHRLLRRLIGKVVSFALCIALIIGSFYFHFEKELGPLIKVSKRVFLD